MTLQLQQSKTVNSITGDLETSPLPSHQVVLSHGKLLPLSALPGGVPTDLDDVPDSTSRLAMVPAERTKLANIESLATAAGTAGDAHALLTGNPHGTTASEVGAAAASHTHPITDVNNLTAVLDGKSPLIHIHTEAEVAGLTADLANKAALAHLHAIADVTGLQTALDGKATTAQVNPYMQIMAVNGALTGPLVKCTSAMTAVTLIDANTYRVQVIYNAGANPINVTAFAGTSILGLSAIAVGAVAKFVTLQGGTQVQQLPA